MLGLPLHPWSVDGAGQTNRSRGGAATAPESGSLPLGFLAVFLLELLNLLLLLLVLLEPDLCVQLHGRLHDLWGHLEAQLVQLQLHLQVRVEEGEVQVGEHVRLLVLLPGRPPKLQGCAQVTQLDRQLIKG